MPNMNMIQLIMLKAVLTVYILSAVVTYASNPTSSPTSQQSSFISCNNSNSKSLYQDHSWLLSPYYKKDLMEMSQSQDQDQRILSTSVSDSLWIPVNYTYYIQYPYDVEMCERYAENSDDVMDFLVYKNDSSFEAGSSTLPRTEMRMEDCDMTSGIYRFTGDFLVDCATSGVTIFQIFDEYLGPQLMLRVYDGVLDAQNAQGLTPLLNYTCGIYYSLDVRFEAEATSYCVFVNDMLEYQFNNESTVDALYYFKAGAYSTNKASDRMEIFYKNIKAYKYNATVDPIKGMCIN
jgi:hypothetical protein